MEALGKGIRRSLGTLAILVLTAVSANADAGEYPLVASLSNDDILFRQIQADVAAYRVAAAREAGGGAAPALLLFRYRLLGSDDLASVAARLGIGQSALATLNRSATPSDFKARGEVIIPNIPGVFVPAKPVGDLELALARRRSSRSGKALPVVLARGGEKVSGFFYPGDELSSQELVIFYRGYFRNPLQSGRISSRFGLRVSPFGGGSTWHTGLDVVAPRGDPVLAAQSGTVTELGSSARYGTYVIVAHDGGYETLYAHLASTAVKLRQSVASGSILGGVGNTGLTTGTHLHFEIRRNGVPLDPLQYLPRTGGIR